MQSIQELQNKINSLEKENQYLKSLQKVNRRSELLYTVQRIQNRIRELAAFRNPVFYKNQAMGLSNFLNGRFIYLEEDENGYIRIPKGLLEIATELLELTFGKNPFAKIVGKD